MQNLPNYVAVCHETFLEIFSHNQQLSFQGPFPDKDELYGMPYLFGILPEKKVFIKRSIFERVLRHFPSIILTKVEDLNIREIMKRFFFSEGDVLQDLKNSSQ